jgi:hypothetical protein
LRINLDRIDCWKLKLHPHRDVPNSRSWRFRLRPTTLGAALAERLGLPHEDADAFFWVPTQPPFITCRPADERLVLLQQRLPATGHWVFTGSAIRWATLLEPYYDMIVFLRLDPKMRLERLKGREILRYGARIEGEGDMVAASAEFLEWAASYDTAGLEHYGLATHETWLADQQAALLRLDSAMPVQDLVSAVLCKPA